LLFGEIDKERLKVFSWILEMTLSDNNGKIAMKITLGKLSWQ
jgi:hypothetical protein